MFKLAKTFQVNKEISFTIDDLQKAGIDIIKGCDYGLDKLITIPNTTLTQTRKILSKIKNPLAEEIANMRREQL